MVRNIIRKRLPGRPKSFDRAEALDRALAMFWVSGYEGVDVERIARSVGVTKPSLYRAFGDKTSLFMKAIGRYAESYSAEIFSSFLNESDITKAVAAFISASVKVTTSEEGRTGCPMACAVSGTFEGSDEVRQFVLKGLAAAAKILTDRFEKEIASGRLSASIPASSRAQLLIDAMQGIALRARTGVPRSQLLKQALGYLPIILG
jgi:AcrR family transcriptional regulator